MKQWLIFFCSNHLEKSLQLLMDRVDDMSQEIVKYNTYSRNLSKQQQQKHQVSLTQTHTHHLQTMSKQHRHPLSSVCIREGRMFPHTHSHTQSDALTHSRPQSLSGKTAGTFLSAVDTANCCYNHSMQTADTPGNHSAHMYKYGHTLWTCTHWEATAVTTRVTSKQ